MNKQLIYCLEDTSIPECHVSISPEYSYSFEEQLSDIVQEFDKVLNENNLMKKHLVFAKLFLSDYINQKPFIEEHKPFSSLLSECAVSVVEQAPLDGTKISVIFFFLKTEDLRVERKNNAFLIYVEGKLHIYHTVSKFTSSDPYSQVQEAFQSHINLLAQHGLSLKHNCHRTWIYSRDVDKDYGQIVDSRNRIFDLQDLTKQTHYITSTGIEGKGFDRSSDVNIDFYSIQETKPEQVKYLEALDYLNPTHEYGVAFERGTSISYADKKHLFISGTASIDKHGDCVFRNDVLKQTERLFLNIEKLLGSGGASFHDIAQMIVYLRNVSDYPVVKNYLEIHFPNTPKAVVLARVCRPEWLIEVECLASKRI
ncbi:MAG: Endoribonuclease [Bacteroidetes bacterium]|jgi:enamine deaminase RidA (YjgF/YER057c/UK114 family)|nr:Endoribonuclease [Bacteroidota bacterium]